MINKLIIICFFVIITISQAASSKFGLTCNTVGNLYIPYTTAGSGRSFEVASTDSFHINARNFSMWTNILNSTFSIGLDYHLSASYNGKTDDFLDDWYIQNVLIAAPVIQNKLAVGVGIQPVSQINQHVINSITVDGQQIDEYLYIHGGLGRAFLNVAYQIIPQFGVGLAYEFNFGNMQKDYRLEFVEPIQTSLLIDMDSRTSGQSFAVSANASPIRDITLGFMWRPKIDLTVNRSAVSNSDEINQKSKINMTIPAEYNFGLQFLLNDRWVLGSDLFYQDWEKGFLVDGSVDDTKKPYYKVGLGFERKNSGKRFDKYYRKLVYRGGLFYDQKLHKSNNVRVQEYGLSFGISMPLIWNRSKLEFSTIFGRRGDISVNKYEETFLRLGFSLTVGEVWFKNPEE